LSFRGFELLFVREELFLDETKLTFTGVCLFLIFCGIGHMTYIPIVRHMIQDIFRDLLSLHAAHRPNIDASISGVFGTQFVRISNFLLCCSCL